MEKKVLCFFTNAYPYGKGETFIENELNFIAPHFQKIYIFHKNKFQDVRSVPDNVELVQLIPPASLVKIRLLFSNFFLLFYFLIQEVFFSRQKKLFREHVRYNVSHFLNCIYYANEIKFKLPEEVLKNAFFYSYWFFDWNLSLSILKYKKVIYTNYTRAHGFDLYENNGKENYLPLRKFCLNHTDKIFVISKTGESYLKSIYPSYSQKIILSYLGTKDFGINPISTNNNVIHIVSCSNMNQVKRVHLIVEILKHIKYNVNWTHIGDGPLLDDIKNQVKTLPINVKVDFKGKLSQLEIFEFYKNEPIDVFINTSVSEGLPVSIMEAISFGIPVIATNVGGTSEIVNDYTGILLSAGFNPETISVFLESNFLKIRSQFSRSDCKFYWEKNFECRVNYSKFLLEFL